MSFANYYQNRLVGAPNPHTPVPDLSLVAKEEQPEALAVKFDPALTGVIQKLVSAAGAPNVGVLVDLSLKILDNLLAAAQSGYTKLYLVNPDTNDFVDMDISGSLGRPLDPEDLRDGK